MAIVLRLPKVERLKTERPKKCKHCKGEILQRWGQVDKQIKDTKVRQVKVYRYRCTSCKQTFRHYPEGIERGLQSERLKKLVVICWSFGLSYRGIEGVFSAFGVSLSRMSGWRDVQGEGEAIRKRKTWQPARVVGIDGAWMNGTGVMVAVDMGDGQPLAIGAIDEKDMSSVMRWLGDLKQRHGIGAIVTDDLAMYRGITEKLGLGHQVCQFHTRRWVGKMCRELSKKLPEEWLWMIERIKQIMEELPPDASRQLLELYKQLPGQLRRGRKRTAVDQLRRLLIRLSESWDRYTTFFHDAGIPWTNNRTEQTIGKMKVRAKTVRGYKTPSGMLNGLLVSSAKFS